MPGNSLQAVARSLSAEGLLQHPQSFVREAKRDGLAGRIRAGEYLVEPGTTPRQMLDMFVAGRVWLHSVTLPEGWTFRQALAAVQGNPDVVPTLADVDEHVLLEALGLVGRSAEGMLFPDTYLFASGTTDLEILQQARDRLDSELEAAWSSRQEDLPLAGPYEALILASIVEKETARADEREETSAPHALAFCAAAVAARSRYQAIAPAATTMTISATKSTRIIPPPLLEYSAGDPSASGEGSLFFMELSPRCTRPHALRGAARRSIVRS